VQGHAGVRDDPEVGDRAVVAHERMPAGVLDDERRVALDGVAAQRMREREGVQAGGRPLAADEDLPLAVDARDGRGRRPEQLDGEAGQPVQRLVRPGVEEPGGAEGGQACGVVRGAASPT